MGFGKQDAIDSGKHWIVIFQGEVPAGVAAQHAGPNANEQIGLIVMSMFSLNASFMGGITGANVHIGTPLEIQAQMSGQQEGGTPN